MLRLLLVLALAVALSRPALAQPQPPPAAVVQPADDEIKPIKLTIHPAAAPSPALRYRLLPELRERRAGNAALDYYRSFAEEMGSASRKMRENALMAWEDHRKMPPEELRGFANFVWLRQLDIGARRTYCDWDMLERLRKDGIATLLPDVQLMRERINILSARVRFELADGHIDDAMKTFETGLQLAQHISEGPTLIQFLVGLAAANIMLEQLEFVFEHPKGPNLYWALSSLPRPFVSVRTSMQGERLMLDALFPGLRDMLYDVKSKPLSVSAANDLADKTLEFLSQVDRPPTNDKILNRLGLAVLAARAHPDARKFLLAQGRAPRDVEAIPMLQAYLLYEMYNFDRIFDTFGRWMHLPYLEGYKGLQESDRQIKQEKANLTTGRSTGSLLALLLVPAVHKVKEAEYRSERKIAGLRCLEAIRMYAAGHDGQLPARLEDVKEVPLPIDPLTGRHFEYQLNDNVARLTAPVPPGWRGGPFGISWIYEIHVKK